MGVINRYFPMNAGSLDFSCLAMATPFNTDVEKSPDTY
jgi:hypothetical protein